MNVQYYDDETRSSRRIAADEEAARRERIEFDRERRLLLAEIAVRDWAIRDERRRNREYAEVCEWLRTAPRSRTAPPESAIVTPSLTYALRIASLADRLFPLDSRRRQTAKNLFQSSRRFLFLPKAMIRRAIAFVRALRNVRRDDPPAASRSDESKNQYNQLCNESIKSSSLERRWIDVEDAPSRRLRIDDEGSASPSLASRTNLISSPHGASIAAVPRDDRTESFVVLASSAGNYFFGEIRDLLVAGLRESGFAARSGDENDFHDATNDRRVIIAPHEFFYLGIGASLRDSPRLGKAILVNTEQPATVWFARALPLLRSAGAVWDIDSETAARLRSMRITSEHLPLGYAASFAPYESCGALPETDATRRLDPAIRSAEAANRSLHERPIDVLFVGGKTPRREELFAAAAPILADYHCYLHISVLDCPHIPGSTTAMNTETAIGLSRRARVLLNVHRGDDRYFEWHRIVLHGLWQGTLVITEPSGAAPPFRSGLDYVEAEPERMASVLRYYLSDPEGMERGAEIARSGRETLIRECVLADVVAGLVAKLWATERGGSKIDVPLIKHAAMRLGRSRSSRGSRRS